MNADKAVEKLMRIKAKVADGSRELDKATGALESNMARLKNEFGCVTVKEAKEKLDMLSAKIEKQEALLVQGVKKLEADYEW